MPKRPLVKSPDTLNLYMDEFSICNVIIISSLINDKKTINVFDNISSPPIQVFLNNNIYEVAATNI